jgi:hypothetical protein
LWKNRHERKQPRQSGDFLEGLSTEDKDALYLQIHRKMYANWADEPIPALRTKLPGNRSGEFGFRLLYTFHRGITYEVQNRTAHAFVNMAMVPATDGYDLFFAIYVKRANWFTPVYMVTIDPFRRLVMYPNALRSIERRWRARWGSL